MLSKGVFSPGTLSVTSLMVLLGGGGGFLMHDDDNHNNGICLVPPTVKNTSLFMNSLNSHNDVLRKVRLGSNLAWRMELSVEFIQGSREGKWWLQLRDVLGRPLLQKRSVWQSHWECTEWKPESVISQGQQQGEGCGKEPRPQSPACSSPGEERSSSILSRAVW